MGINGSIYGKSYVSTLTRGTGMEYLGGNQSWAWAGRVGSAINDVRYLPNPGFGLSWFTGNVRLGDGTLSKRSLMSADMTQYVRRFGLLVQLGIGRIDDRRVVSALGEVNLANSLESRAGYIQVSSKNIDTLGGWESESSIALGVRFGERIGAAFSTQYVYELESLNRSGGRGVFQIQFRYRWS